MRVYDLRHTSATHLLEAGEHPKILSERLGHSTVMLTLDTYGRVLPDMQHRTAEKLDPEPALARLALERHLDPTSPWVSPLVTPSTRARNWNWPSHSPPCWLPSPGWRGASVGLRGAPRSRTRLRSGNRRTCRPSSTRAIRSSTRSWRGSTNGGPTPSGRDWLPVRRSRSTTRSTRIGWTWRLGVLLPTRPSHKARTSSSATTCATAAGASAPSRPTPLRSVPCWSRILGTGPTIGDRAKNSQAEARVAGALPHRKSTTGA